MSDEINAEEERSAAIAATLPEVPPLPPTVAPPDARRRSHEATVVRVCIGIMIAALAILIAASLLAGR